MLTGLWNLKDFQNSQQNRSKNKLVGENAMTHGSCSLRVMGSWLLATHQISPRTSDVRRGWYSMPLNKTKQKGAKTKKGTNQSETKNIERRQSAIK